MRDVLDPRCSRHTTSAGSIPRRSTRTAPTASVARSSSSSGSAGSPSAATCGVSAPTMTAAVIEGAADGGADVLDLGMVGTEMLYYAVGELALEGGIVVTASHNPKQYSGMKIVRARRAARRRRLRPRRRAARGGRGVRRGRAPRRGDADRTSGTASSRRCSRSSTRTSLRPLRIVVDAANGMAGTMLPPVLERLPQLDVVRCFFEPDGSFPNHEPNPLLPENREFIVERTRAEGADLGVAYDGDADRCFFVDDTGEFVPGDFVTALLARAMLAEGAGRERPLRRAGELGCAARDRGGRAASPSSTASATRSSRSACARSMRCSPARSPRTTTSATSRRPTPGSSRSSSCSSSSRPEGASCRSSSRRSASGTS